MKKEVLEFDLWGIVKSISTLGIVGVFCVKVYQTPIDLTVDFPTLLSLLLGFFSVGLAALFYFKATETSNTFYDNTYKFTNQISELLVKIESGFGERLKHLDEGYASVREYIQNPNSQSKDDIESTKSKIKEEQKEIEKVSLERNKIIQELFSKAQLQEEEKAEIRRSLESKEQELNEAQNELSKMKKRLFADRLFKRNMNRVMHQLPENALDFSRKIVLPQLGGSNILEHTLSEIKNNFEQISDNYPNDYINDLIHADLYDSDGLTTAGARFFSQIARES